MKKQNKGITLVALVITIIVLIILAAVSINAVMNEGLITNAKEAKNVYDNATKKEQTELSTLLAEVEHYELPDVVAGGYTGTSNAKYKDSEGALAIIPAGFTVSGIESENKISKGLVIYSGNVALTEFTTDDDSDGIINAQENHNQYVWIPVENPSDIYGTIEGTVDGILGTTTDGFTTSKFGKLYFGEYINGSWKTNTIPASHYNWPGKTDYSSSGVREPANPSTGTGTSVPDINIKFNNMIASVEKYKGFYIGRYELATTGGVPIVRKGVVPDAGLTFARAYNYCKDLASTNTASAGKIETSLLWGCQWDQAVKKCLDFDPLYLTTNSNLYGNYKDSSGFEYTKADGTTGIKVEGTSVNGIVSGCVTQAYNLYDIGGNLWEWTFLMSQSTKRTYRGGSWSENSNDKPAISRTSSDPGIASVVVGCRPQLYIK